MGPQLRRVLPLIGFLLVLYLARLFQSRSANHNYLLIAQVNTPTRTKVMASERPGISPMGTCMDLPRQDAIPAALAFASRPEPEIARLRGACEKREYTWATLDEVRLRILTVYTKLVLAELNSRCRDFAKINILREPCPTGEPRIARPFHFGFIQIINAGCSVDREGNSRWRVNLMVEEMILHLSQKLILDFTVMVDLPTEKSRQLATCAEYTTFPFPRLPLGYPMLDQVVPLPTQVITTGGPGSVLSMRGMDADLPNFKAIYLNRVWTENSDLALGTELPSTLNCEVPPAVNDTTLPSSAVQARLKRSDVKFPEKDMADCIEAKGLGIDTDIVTDYSLKPKNWKDGCPENAYHFKGSTQSFARSMAPQLHPNGWIEPAVERNKWPRLWSEPRDRMAWPCTGPSQKWDNTGIPIPQAKDSDTCPGFRWATEQQPRTPNYWPTLTGLPMMEGPNAWLFGNLREGTATDAATRPTR